MFVKEAAILCAKQLESVRRGLTVSEIVSGMQFKMCEIKPVYISFTNYKEKNSLSSHDINCNFT